MHVQTYANLLSHQQNYMSIAQTQEEHFFESLPYNVSILCNMYTHAYVHAYAPHYNIANTG